MYHFIGVRQVAGIVSEVGELLPLLEDVEEHFDDFLGDKRDAPGEDVHEVGEDVGVGRVVELLYIESVLLELDDGSLVVVHVAVVGRRKYCDHHRKFLWPVPLVHFVPVELGLVRSQDRQQFVLVQKLIRGRLSEEKRTPPHVVLHEALRALPLFVFHWVRPQNVAKQSLARRFLESL